MIISSDHPHDISKSISIAISDPPDLVNVKKSTPDLDLALEAVVTELVRHGLKVLYAGDLRPAGFTAKISTYTAGLAYLQDTPPFIHVLMSASLQMVNFDELGDILFERAGKAQTYAFIRGKLEPLDWSFDGLHLGSRVFSNKSEFEQYVRALPVATMHETSAERIWLSRRTGGCVALGGKMGTIAIPSDLYAGALPGVVEEGIFALQADKPVVISGAYGGAARDMAIALGLLDSAVKTRRGVQVESYHRAIAELTPLSSRIPTEVFEMLVAAAKTEKAYDFGSLAVSVITNWRPRPTFEPKTQAY